MAYKNGRNGLKFSWEFKKIIVKNIYESKQSCIISQLYVYFKSLERGQIYFLGTYLCIYEGFLLPKSIGKKKTREKRINGTFFINGEEIV